MINYRLTYTIVSLLTLCSISVLLFVFNLEYFLNILPCKLCVWQRWPQLALVIIGIGILGTAKFRVIGCYLAIFSALTGLVLGGYHYGIENNLIQEISSCTNNSLDTLNKSKLLESLNKNMPVDCKDATFKILGVSLAAINTILSILIVIISIRTLTYETNK